MIEGTYFKDGHESMFRLSYGFSAAKQHCAENSANQHPKQIVVLCQCLRERANDFQKNVVS